MQKSYYAFLNHTNSDIVKKDNPYPHFKTYAFSSEIGRGYSAIYDVGSYAHICIADHLYYEDFKYTYHRMKVFIFSNMILLLPTKNILQEGYMPECNTFSITLMLKRFSML